VYLYYLEQSTRGCQAPTICGTHAALVCTQHWFAALGIIKAQPWKLRCINIGNHERFDLSSEGEMGREIWKEGGREK
jgi:hypothetical protein